ncbi:glycosyltransferase family 2 protein [Rufibacter radiotolerans]|uniref:glycosyltransferase family 2 protein n=1 Tax=Rufibacter radiotolerans TaxID=1379910 RepID=UPI00066467C8|nr:glycosyltransferase family A protein [Rufibacter radiotolerans]
MENSHQPLVSVIIPFYNDERFIREAIESVLNQTYTQWEILLVDDGSTQNSIDIAQGYADRFPAKIKYLEHEGHKNKGVSASRNLGMRQAMGELFAFLDADDVWLPQKLANGVAIFQEHPEIGLLGEASEYWYNWEDNGKENKVVPVGVSADRVFQPYELSRVLYPLLPNPSPCPSALMISREAFIRSGGFEESFTKENQLYEDQAFLSKIYLQERVYISSCCFNLYRKRVGSIEESVKATGKYHQVRQYFLEWFEGYLQKKHIQDPTITALLETALMPYRHPGKYFLTHTLPKGVRKAVKRGMRKLSIT